VTVPVRLFEPTIDVVLSVSELSVTVAGCNVTVCERLTPVGSVAVTTTGVEELTGFVKTVVVPEVPP